VSSSDLPGVNPTTLNGMILYYRLMTKRSGLGDSTELSRMGLSQTRGHTSSAASRDTSSPTAQRRSRTRMAISTSQGRMASTGQGVTTRASTRMSDDRGRRRAEARPERWLERVMSTPVPHTPPRAQAAVKMTVIIARAGSHPRT
jgi:hypothetical protein